MLNSLKDTDKAAFAFIRNRIVHTGERPTVREIIAVTGNTSPRSGALVIERLVKAGLIKKSGGKIRLTNAQSQPTPTSVTTVNVPLVGVVTCGAPMLAEQNVEAHIPISTSLAKPSHRYFLLRARGNSMNKAGIEDGDIVLVRQQSSAETGDRVVALINDEATIKVFERASNIVILRSRSTEAKHGPIVLTEDCQIQGVVVTTLPSDLY